MSDMEEMLLEHLRTGITGCRCGWSELGKSHPGHVAAALSAAGFGPVNEAREVAFDYGWREGKGWPTPVNVETGELLHHEAHPAPFNPYREASNDDQ